MQIPDHPDIQRMEREGVPCADPVICPVCGDECEWIYKKDGDVIGCDNCVDQISSDIWAEEEEEARAYD